MYLQALHLAAAGTTVHAKQLALDAFNVRETQRLEAQVQLAPSAMEWPRYLLMPSKLEQPVNTSTGASNPVQHGHPCPVGTGRGA